MKNTISIGIDLGHSSVKTAIKSGNKMPVIGGYTIFPTVVRGWTPIANEETARRAEADTVEVNGKKFFVGETAQRQSQAETFTGQNRNWIATEQHDALMASAWNRAMGVLAKPENNMAEPEQISLVLGLPASYYAEQRDALLSRARGLLLIGFEN